MPKSSMDSFAHVVQAIQGLEGPLGSSMMALSVISSTRLRQAVLCCCKMRSILLGRSWSIRSRVDRFTAILRSRPALCI